jgi:uncharacterized protein (DUF1330 family)
MPKGYWVVRVDVTNPDAYKLYVAANAKAFAKYGAKFLVRGGPAESREGSGRTRNVVIEFKDDDTAKACYDSPEYREAMSCGKTHHTQTLSLPKAMTVQR